MRFDDIVSLLKSNHRYKAKRKNWVSYIKASDSNTLIACTGDIELHYTPSCEDLIVNDWEIVKE